VAVDDAAVVVVVDPPDAPGSGNKVTAVRASALVTTKRDAVRPNEVRNLFISFRPLLSISPANMVEIRVRQALE
jgi:hypothetical protein